MNLKFSWEVSNITLGALRHKHKHKHKHLTRQRF